MDSDKLEVCGSAAISGNLEAGVYELLRINIEVVCKWEKSVVGISEEMVFSPKMILLRPVKIVQRWG